MDSPKNPPLVFANRIIRQFVDHLLGSDRQVSQRDFQVIRLVFRRGGGAWEDLYGGDVKHLVLLENVIKSWGKFKNHA